MKAFTGKKFFLVLALLLCAAMTLAMSSSMLFVSADAEEDGPRTLYYIDAGNLVDANGYKITVWNGTYGYPSTEQTSMMKEKGYIFATAAHAEEELYNSVTDKPYGLDETSGKEWGFSGYTAEGWDWWRHTPTASTEDGYDTARFIQNGEGILTYKFEVDDDSLLKINLGTRKIAGWADVQYTLTINGVNRGLVSVTETESEVSYYARGVYDETADKYFLTMNFGDGNQYAYVNWLEIITAGDDAGYDSAPYAFVVKGETPRLYDWENNFIYTEISAEDRVKIDSADYFSQVTVNCSVGDITYSDVAVTVIPANLKYFVDVGGSGDGRLMLADTVYVAGENTYGLVGAEGTTGWEAFDYIMSCRYNGVEKEIRYHFDAGQASYGIIAGTIGHWGARNSMMQVNSDIVVAFDALPLNAEGQPVFSTTTVTTTVSSGEAIDILFSAGTSTEIETSPLVNFIAVYEKEVVSFDTAGGAALDPVLFDGGVPFDLSQIAPEREHYIFEGWYTENGEKVTFVSESVTLTARWALETYTVTFESNGGSAVASENVAYGKQATEPEAPVREGFTFAGWFDEALENKYDFSTGVEEDMTLYAKWETSQTPPGTGDGNKGDDGEEPAGGCSSAVGGGTAVMSVLAAGIVLAVILRKKTSI